MKKEQLRIANDSVSGVHPTGRVTMVVADGVRVEVGMLVKLDGGKIKPAFDADSAYGVAEDSGNAGDNCTVAVLGAATGSVLMLPDSTITQGSYLRTSDEGFVQAWASGDGQVVGVAMEDGVAGELFEVAPLGTPF